MTFRFNLPDIGEGTAEAEIGAWHVAPGDLVREDQLLVDIMTDKATVEMTSPVAGRVTAIHGEVGQMVPVGALLVEFVLGEDGAATPGGEDESKSVAAAEPAREQATSEAVKAAQPSVFDTPPPLLADVTVSRDDRVILASPATRKLAYERGIDLRFVAGTGPEGRVLLEDLDRPIRARGEPAPVHAADVITDLRIIGLRRRIAEKMQEATRQIPHFGYVEEFDLTELETLRADLNATRSEKEPKLTLLPFFIRAVVALAPDFPQINARFDDANGVLKMHGSVHVGIATQTSGGLVVPVIRHAERLDIWDCAAELARVTSAARDGTAKREELSGSTITLTSLGTLGGIAATPIINHPEVAIIGPNKLVDRPVVIGGQIVIRKMMNVSSSFDHRIVDGHDAARFIQAMKRLIERPSLLFIGRKK
jgi:2-oxoisovalerate dehydrogenase E2 component (dihydrolipoyl transacylase)